MLFLLYYRIYLPYQEGIKELINLGKEYNISMVGIGKYIRDKHDIKIKALLKDYISMILHSVPREAEKVLR